MAAAPVAAALVLTLAGCGGAAEPSSDDAAGIGVEEAPSRPADDAASAQAAIEGLLRDHDRVVNEIAADPGRVTDPSDALVQEYLALYEPGSEAVARAVSNWTEQAAAGRSTVPASADHPAFASRLDGPVELVGEGEARFPTCDEQRYAVVDADGNPVNVQPAASVPGEGIAVAVDGEWRLRRLDVRPGAPACESGEG